MTTNQDSLIELIAHLERRLDLLEPGTEAYQDVAIALSVRQDRLAKVQAQAVKDLRAISPAGQTVQAWFDEQMYAVTLPGVRGEAYQYAPNAFAAIAQERATAGLPGTTGGTARKALHGEWDCPLTVTGDHVTPHH